MGKSDEETAVLEVATRPPRPDTSLETKVDKPLPSGTDKPVTPGTSIGSSIEALERDEILRTRSFSWVVISLVTVGSAATFFVPGGQRDGQAVMLAACSATFLSMLFLQYQTRDPLRFRQPRTALIWFVPSIAVNAPVYYFGVFSAASMLVVLGLYFVGLGRAGRMAIAAYVVCALLQGAIATNVILTGRDPGIVHPTLTTTQQIMIALLQQFIMLVTVVISRTSRTTALMAVGELEQAVRLAAHRQALLVEAREELERALRSTRGRFSEQTIGSYQLGDVLGRGAMGEVYAAVDTRSGAQVAIKLLSQASLRNADHVLRFFRELRTAAKVESPHVVRVIEVGEQPVPYLVMERLEGQTLSEILRDRRVLSPEEVVALISQVATGITAAAAVGIVHRDLKPQNVFRHLDVWKVLDFGVARAIEHGETLTAGQIVGTPSYMSPEQATGAEIDHRSDLYAVAAIAYRALTGYPPFASTDIAETLYRVVHTRPIRPSLLAPELPGDVDLVLAIGMASQASARFSTGGELASALRDAVGGALDPATRARAAAILNVAGWSSVTPKARRARSA
ncbi:MAG TPA: serine/threonine-protein kinase [Kofleriaceae bacterium]|nr:serine/threonine-protein kinase [Kofleriaceae bacterium]